MQENIIYLDHCASVPVYDEVKELIRELFDVVKGNAAAANAHGRESHRLLEEARSGIASYLKRDPHHIIFTSGATEANNLIIQGISKHIDLYIIDPTSHVSAIYPTKRFNHVLLKVNQYGEIDQNYMHDLIRENSNKKICLVLTPVNHITGLYHNIDLSNIPSNVIVHGDCAQSLHKIKDFSNYHSFTLSGQKIGTPPGIGVLVINQDIYDNYLSSIFFGGNMEHGFRPGSVNTVYAIAMNYAINNLLSTFTHPDHSDFERVVVENGGIIIGKDLSNDKRVGYISCIVMPNVSNELQLIKFDSKKISISTGSICSKYSYVLDVMGHKGSKEMIRVSSGRMNKQDDIIKLTDAWVEIKSESYRL